VLINKKNALTPLKTSTLRQC